ncbi:MAG: extracellular solute-binding protein [Rhodospirillaceae bacterium]
MLDFPRSVLARACLALAFAFASLPSHAAHGLALGAAPKYPPGFTHFGYVNPDAPKGGDLYLSALGSFDKLNPYTLKGTAPTAVNDLVFEPLVVQSEDEPFSVYGLLAKDLELAPDELSITFRLDERARFSNGDPVTAADVKHSYEMLTSKAATPIYRAMWSDVKRLVVVDPLRVRFEFKRRNRELHMIVGQLPVFSRKWGNGKPFDAVTLDTPIGSGPYVMERMDLGKNIVFRRKTDYWGANLPTRRGMFNFERIFYRFYRDELVRLEAFKAGEFDFNHENVAKNWARGYTGSKFERGEIIKRELTHQNPQGMQAYVFNLRRPIFKDIRVREALSLAMDYEWMNRQLFYNQYKRSYSYFTNSDMAATGSPSLEELKLMEPARKYLDPAAFEPVRMPPTTTPPHSLRDNLRRARELLREAGWTYRDGALRNAKGEPFEFEVLINRRSWERVVAPFARNLEKLGIQLNSRVIDAALYAKRVDDFDFDMIVHWYLSSQSPGNELYLRFASETADEKGSHNMMGLQNPGIDRLVQAVLTADTRQELIIACRALDRALLAGQYVIPHWHNTVHRVAYKNRFGIPKEQPLYYQPEDWLVKAWWALNR